MSELPNGGQYRVTGNGKLVRAMTQDGQTHGRMDRRGPPEQRHEDMQLNPSVTTQSQAPICTNVNTVVTTGAGASAHELADQNTNVNTCIASTEAPTASHLNENSRPSTSGIQTFYSTPHTQGATVPPNLFNDLSSRFRFPPYSGAPQMYAPPVGFAK